MINNIVVVVVVLLLLPNAIAEAVEYKLTTVNAEHVHQTKRTPN